MEEPGPRPKRARARNTSIKVLRVIDDLRLRHYRTIEVVLAQPGDQLRDLVAGEAASIDSDETKSGQGARWVHLCDPPAGDPESERVLSGLPVGNEGRSQKGEGWWRAREAWRCAGVREAKAGGGWTR